jgi:ABC-type transport system involved in cytochrome bd biosynthesis fused ATPase/permease subunit
LRHVAARMPVDSRSQLAYSGATEAPRGSGFEGSTAWTSPLLPCGAIRDNTAQDPPSPSEAEIVEAAQATHIERFVRAPRRGYTVLDDEGSNASPGRKQLPTMARAFLSRPSV